MATLLLTLLRVTLAALLVVAASTALLPSISGYGTSLFQIVVLGGWSIVAAVTSGSFADLHHFPVWSVAAILNLGLFALPAFAIVLLTRKRRPLFGASLVAVWLVFYLACLFVLFPATDGP